jgi:hypothetical protein
VARWAQVLGLGLICAALTAASLGVQALGERQHLLMAYRLVTAFALFKSAAEVLTLGEAL